MFSTLVLVVGISKYKSGKIPPLPAAAGDATRIAEALVSWGIPAPNLTLLLNENATKENVEGYFQQLLSRKEPLKFLFYFCGHGFRNPPPHPKSFLTLFDTAPSERENHALSLDLLSEKIHQTPAMDSYVFIDACSLRINTITNPNLRQELKGNHAQQKGFFCLLSSGILKSFEDAEKKYGYFTDVLLRSLGTLCPLKASPSALLHLINAGMREKNLPLPEMYNFGIEAIDFIPSKQVVDFVQGERRYLWRSKAIASLQNLLIEHHGKVLCLIGSQGMGKTVLCQQMQSREFGIVYCSISAETGLHSFVDTMLKRFPTLKEKNRPLEESLLAVLTFLEKHYFYYLFIVDHFDDVTQIEKTLFLNLLIKRNLRFLLVCRKSFKNVLASSFSQALVEWKIPPLTNTESQQLLEFFQVSYSDSELELLYLASKGNPSKLYQLAFASSLKSLNKEKKEEIKKGIAAVCSCGIYIDQVLFSQVFGIKDATLYFLEQGGLITKTEDYWFPHELLYEIVESEKLQFDKTATLNYWLRQVKELPTHIQGLKSFILVVKCFGYEQEIDPFLKNAFQQLYQDGKKNLESLIDGVDIFLPHGLITKASLCLAEIFIEWKEFGLVQDLLSGKNAQEALELKATMSASHRHWEIGEFEESVHLTAKILPILKAPADILKCRFHHGVASFFLGKWEEALADFSFLCDHTENARILGIAKCMLGTIFALRGTDIEKGKDLIKSGIQLCVKEKDLLSAWTGWNNLGEVLWKMGEYQSARVYLEKAKDIGVENGNAYMQLESFRNLLQLHLRFHGPFAEETETALSNIEALGWSSWGNFEAMQIVDTLASLAIFKGDLGQARSLIKKAIPLTKKSGEFFIYTLANLFLLSQAQGETRRAQAFLLQAMHLAKSNKNFLAIRQINNDIELLKKYR